MNLRPSGYEPEGNASKYNRLRDKHHIYVRANVMQVLKDGLLLWDVAWNDETRHKNGALRFWNLDSIIFVRCNTAGMHDDSTFGDEAWQEILPVGTYSYVSAGGARKTVKAYTMNLDEFYRHQGVTR